MSAFERRVREYIASEQAEHWKHFSVWVDNRYYFFGPSSWAPYKELLQDISKIEATGKTPLVSVNKKNLNTKEEIFSRLGQKFDPSKTNSVELIYAEIKELIALHERHSADNWLGDAQTAEKKATVVALVDRLRGLKKWTRAELSAKNIDELLFFFSVNHYVLLIQELDSNSGVYLPESFDDFFAELFPEYKKNQTIKKVLLTYEHRKNLTEKLQKSLFSIANSEVNPRELIQDVSQHVLKNKITAPEIVNELFLPFESKAILKKNYDAEAANRAFFRVKHYVSPRNNKLNILVDYLDTKFATQALDVLLDLGPRSSDFRKLLIQKLRSPKIDVQAMAVQLLGSSFPKDNGVQDLLIDRVSHRSEKMRASALSALRKTGLRKITLDGVTVYPDLDAIAKALLNEEYSSNVALFIDVLKTHAPNEVVTQAAFAKLMQSNNESIRNLAAAAIKGINIDDDVAGYLYPVVTSKSPMIRRGGIAVIESLVSDASTAQGLLVDLLDDEDPLVRYAASDRLKELELLPEHWARVRDLTDPKLVSDFSIRIPALRVIMSLADKDPASLNVLLKALEDPDSDLRNEAYYRLREIYFDQKFKGAGSYNQRLYELSKKNNLTGNRALDLLLRDPKITSFFDTSLSNKEIEETLIAALGRGWPEIRKNSLKLIGDIISVKEGIGTNLLRAYYDEILNEKSFSSALDMIGKIPTNISNHPPDLRKKRSKMLTDLAVRNFQQKKRMLQRTDPAGSVHSWELDTLTKIQDLVGEQLDSDDVKNFFSLMKNNSYFTLGRRKFASDKDLLLERLVLSAAREHMGNSKIRKLVVEHLAMTGGLSRRPIIISVRTTDLGINLLPSELERILDVWFSKKLVSRDHIAESVFDFLIHSKILDVSTRVRLVLLLDKATDPSSFANKMLLSLRLQIVLPNLICD